MEPINKVSGKIAPLPINDIDTDQIIPARFLKTTDKEGLGKQAFFDWRYEADGSDKADFVLNQPQYQDAEILIAGKNFGCGTRTCTLGIDGYGLESCCQYRICGYFP